MYLRDLKPDSFFIERSAKGEVRPLYKNPAGYISAVVQKNGVLYPTSDEVLHLDPLTEVQSFVCPSVHNDPLMVSSG